MAALYSLGVRSSDRRILVPSLAFVILGYSAFWRHWESLTHATLLITYSVAISIGALAVGVLVRTRGELHTSIDRLEEAQVQLVEQAERRARAQERAAYYTVQEGLTNVERYAPDAEVSVTCRVTGGRFTVSVENGPSKRAGRSCPRPTRAMSVSRKGQRSSGDASVPDRPARMATRSEWKSISTGTLPQQTKSRAAISRPAPRSDFRDSSRRSSSLRSWRRAAAVPDRTITVVVVDDEALVRTGFTHILNSASDIDVVATADRFSAVEVIEEVSPDVVLLDVRMPGKNGLEVLSETCRGPVHPVVAMLTTFDTDEYIATTLAGGVSGFLVKDTDPSQLPHSCGPCSAAGWSSHRRSAAR